MKYRTRHCSRRLLALGAFGRLSQKHDEGLGGTMGFKLFKSRRQRFRETRTPLTNEAFIAALHTADADVLSMLAVRQAMGRSLGVPFEHILPDEPLSSLLALGGEDWDMSGFIMGLEETLGVEIPDELAARCPSPYPVRRLFRTVSPGPSDFGTWAADVVSFMNAEGIKPTTNR